MGNPLTRLTVFNKMGLWSYSVSRSVSLPLLLHLLIILAIPVYLTIAIIVVLAGGEFQTVPTTGTPGNFNQTVKLWYQTFLPNKVSTKSAWHCNPNLFKTGDRRLLPPSLLIVELLTNVTQLNTYSIAQVVNSGSVFPNALNYSNNAIQECFILEIELIPSVNYVDTTRATVPFECCIVLKLGDRGVRYSRSSSLSNSSAGLYVIQRRVPGKKRQPDQHQLLQLYEHSRGLDLLALWGREQ